MTALRWKIVSGGQTGVDRAALDVARSLGLAYGGFVPKGRRTEEGPLPDDYSGMIETESADYAVRTRRNVAGSDATLVLTRGTPDRGTALTLRIARASGKPVLAVDLDERDVEPARRIADWLRGLAGGTLNVAGPRESRKPGIYAAARSVLIEALNEAGLRSSSPRRTS